MKKDEQAMADGGHRPRLETALSLRGDFVQILTIAPSGGTVSPEERKALFSRGFLRGVYILRWEAFPIMVLIHGPIRAQKAVSGPFWPTARIGHPERAIRGWH
jgi:hypothetical protein